MKVKTIAVVGMCMVMVFGQAIANFELCYGSCYLECILEFKKHFPFMRIDKKKFLPCAWRCLKKCIFDGAAASQATTKPNYYCSLGCSIDSCADSFDGN